MIVTTLVATLTLGLQAPKPLVCPVMGTPVNEKLGSYDYAGMRIGICCAGCDAKVKANPAQTLADAAKKGWTSAQTLFDPISGERALKVKATTDYKGVRYAFVSAENKAKFDKDPAKFSKAPKKDLLTCVVANEDINGYANASNFIDAGDVRYYICCQGCLPKANGPEGKELFAKFAEKATPVAIHNVDPNKRHEGEPK